MKLLTVSMMAYSNDIYSIVCDRIVLIILIVCIALLIAGWFKGINEKEMKKLEKENAERQRLLDFCYKLAEKKESETMDFVKKTTTKTTTKDGEETITKDETVTELTNTEGGRIDVTITLDQIRQDCWKIIEKLSKELISEKTDKTTNP